MARLLRSVGVLALILLGLGCGGGGGATTEDPAMAGVDLASHQSAAHIVCTSEDPCGKGYICLSGIRCAKVCKADSDCPTGQFCTGAINGKKFCQ
jgi:hypothetical protein